MVHERSTTGNNFRHAMRCASLWSHAARAQPGGHCCLISISAAQNRNMHACVLQHMHACVHAGQSWHADTHVGQRARSQSTCMDCTSMHACMAIDRCCAQDACLAWAWALSAQCASVGFLTATSLGNVMSRSCCRRADRGCMHACAQALEGGWAIMQSRSITLGAGRAGVP